MIRMLTAGESHGPMLTAIVEGIPAGLSIDLEDINKELLRRQKGYGSGGRMRIEQDKVQITSGVVAGMTTGSPISLLVNNRDYENWKNKDIKPMTTPRPGHADLTGAIKYGYRDLRYSLERASARETTMRVVVGAICKKLLQTFGIAIGGYSVQLGSIKIDCKNLSLEDRFKASETNEVRSPSHESVEELKNEIQRAMKAQDTLGGIIEIFALNVPPGLGSYVHYDRRLDSQIAAAMMSIPAMKGVEFSEAFENAGKRGSEVHDEIVLCPDKKKLTRKTNRAGGVEGGISNGQPIVVRVAMKPISTVVKGFQSVNLATSEPELTTYERSDFCALPRAVPIAESMLALVLANAIQEKLGGDSIREMQSRFQELAKQDISNLVMNNEYWKFDYQI